MSPQSFNTEVSLPLDDDQQVWMQFRLIPRGSFLMGSRGHYADEEPMHEVTIPFDYYLGKYPVTQEQFAVWTRLADVDHMSAFEGNPLNPAENLNWFEASKFCEWLQEKHKQQTHSPKYRQLAGFTVMLPTEAQWEYACSAWHFDKHGDESPLRIYTEYHTGDGVAALAQAGWYSANSQGQTQAVGQKSGNRHGVHDMHGNVREWCRDQWDEMVYRHRSNCAIDPCADNVVEDRDGAVRAVRAVRVVRGGSWGDHATFCRTAYRTSNLPVNRVSGYGFRAGLFPVQSCQIEKQQQK